MSLQKPSAGKIIHYKWHPNNPDPTVAIITQSYEAKGIYYLWIRLFPAATNESVALQCTSEDMVTGPREAKAGQWWWPERL